MTETHDPAGQLVAAGRYLTGEMTAAEEEAALADPAFCEGLAEAVLLRDALSGVFAEPPRPRTRRRAGRFGTGVGITVAAALSVAIAFVVATPVETASDGDGLVAAAWDDVRTQEVNEIEAAIESALPVVEDAGVPVWMLAAVEFSEVEAVEDASGLETL